MPTLKLNKGPQDKLYNFLEASDDISKMNIFIWIDVAKLRLDASVTTNTGFQVYLWAIGNNTTWYRKLDEVISKMMELWIDRSKIYLWIENTWQYGQDVADRYDSRLQNTYILNSILSYRYRQFYSKWNDGKSDALDATVISLLLRDLQNNKLLEDDNTPYIKSKVWLWFVRRASHKEISSLRWLFRSQISLRHQKSKIMTKMNGQKYKIFPELEWVFAVKNRASSEMIIIEHFTREQILGMTEEEFIDEYKSFASKWEQVGQVINKMKVFYNLITDRGHKTRKSAIDVLTNDDSSIYLRKAILRSYKQYNFFEDEMDDIEQDITAILDKLKLKWFYIPKFVGINDASIGIFLGEFWSDIYTISKKEMLWFIGWHPLNYSSWGSTVQQSRLSNKNNIIKSILYLRTRCVNLHNPSFCLYSKLLSELYGIDKNIESIVNLKNIKKVQTKAAGKLLTIILKCFQNELPYDENWFIRYTIQPLIKKLQQKWLTDEHIQTVINDVYKKKPQPKIL